MVEVTRGVTIALPAERMHRLTKIGVLLAIAEQLERIADSLKRIEEEFVIPAEECH